MKETSHGDNKLLDFYLYELFRESKSLEAKGRIMVACPHLCVSPFLSLSSVVSICPFLCHCLSVSVFFYVSVSVEGRFTRV